MRSAGNGSRVEKVSRWKAVTGPISTKDVSRTVLPGRRPRVEQAVAEGEQRAAPPADRAGMAREEVVGPRVGLGGERGTDAPPGVGGQDRAVRTAVARAVDGAARQREQLGGEGWGASSV